MPFGLDVKSVVVGIILALFVWPWIAGMMNRPAAGAAQTV